MLGVLISVPVSIWFGRLAYATLIDHLRHGGGWAPIALVAVLVLVIVLIARKVARRTTPAPLPNREHEPRSE
jgi:membrane protein implicated in regulation of membrane protease activity